MSDEPDAQTPEDRAEATARDLADRGMAVTARAIREAAGVRMAVTTAAARAWREATAAASEVEVPEVPEVPEDVSARLSAVWADAYRAAVAVVTPERDRLAVEADELRTELEALSTTVSEVEDERDRATQQHETSQAEQQAAEERLREATQTISSREATITELREQNRLLTSQLDALIARIPTTDTNAEDQNTGEQKWTPFPQMG